MSAPVTSRTVSLEVNGEQIELEVPTRRLLVHFLRDDLGLTGTHIGCDTGNCGACTVHLDGEAVHCTGNYKNYEDAFEGAIESLESGNAKNSLDKLISLQ